MVSNTWAFTNDTDASNGIDFSFPLNSNGDPEEFLADSSAEAVFNVAQSGKARLALWPLTFVSDVRRSRALVFYAKMHALPGDFNFSCVGRSVAVWENFGAPRVRPVLNVVAAEPELMFHGSEPGFGSAAVVRPEQDMLYVYGCGEPKSKACRLARVPLAHVFNRAAWQYFAGGNSWSPQLGASVSVMDANDVLSVAYNTHLRAYVAFYAKPMENQILLRTAPAPEGPWSEPRVAFTTRKPARLWVYDGLAHPEFERESGRIQYLTYSLTTEAGSEVRLVEVELSR
jgi:hypothetical protein